MARILERMVAASSLRIDGFLTPSAWKQPIPELAAATSPPSVRHSSCAPMIATEKILAAAWAEVLKGSEPQPHDHFFELGGHSLLAARVINRVRRDFDMELPVKSLFDRPVLGDLAAYINASRATQHLRLVSGRSRFDRPEDHKATEQQK